MFITVELGQTHEIVDSQPNTIDVKLSVERQIEPPTAQVFMPRKQAFKTVDNKLPIEESYS